MAKNPSKSKAIAPTPAEISVGAPNALAIDLTGIKPGDFQEIQAPHVLANQAVVQSAGSDFIIVFQQAIPVSTVSLAVAPYAVAKSTAVVFMSPGTAKDLSLVLADAVRQWEADWGTIETPYIRHRKDAAK
jgi:hypothetical protein